MKRIFIILVTILASLSNVNAQLFDELNGWDEPLPFSLRDKYRDIIQTDNIEANYVTGSYNNDSLLYALNPPGRKHLLAGIAIDSTVYDFKELAHYFDLGHGNLWLYKITSPTSKELSVVFEKFDLQPGALFSFYQLNGSNPFDAEPYSFYSDNNDDFLGAALIKGNEVYVEYYEPKGVAGLDLKIIKIVYFFTDGLGVSLHRLHKKK